MSHDRRHSRMRKLWNQGEHSLTDIAADVGLTADQVEAYLRTLPGFPDVIEVCRNVCQSRACGREFGAHHGAQRYCSRACAADDRHRRWRARQRGEAMAS